jgi:hypothetical protein
MLENLIVLYNVRINPLGKCKERHFKEITCSITLLRERIRNKHTKLAKSKPFAKNYMKKIDG